MKCIDCDISLEEEEGFFSCPSCGMVSDDKSSYDSRAERRIFSNKDFILKSRSSLVYSRDQELQIEIDLTKKRDFHSRKLSQSSSKFKDVTKKGGSNKSEISFVVELNKISEAIQLPSKIKKKVREYFSLIREKNFARGRSIKGILGALIFIASKEVDTRYVLKEIAQKLDIRKRDIGKVSKLLAKALDLKKGVLDLIEYLPRISSILECSKEEYAMTKEILERLEGTEIVMSKNGRSLVLSVIASVALEYSNKDLVPTIINKFPITELTLKNRMSEISNFLIKK